MIKFEDLIIQENKLFSNGNSLEVTNIITFKNIKFSDITIDNNEITYLGKIIEYNKNISDIGISDNHDLYFKNCSFLGELKLNSLFNRAIRFDNCSFTDIILKNIIRNNEEVKNGFILKNIKSIKNLTIDSCEFHGKFYINKQDDDNNSEVKIEKLIIKDTEFKNNFKLHNCKVDEIEIKNVDFEKNADFYKSKFIKGIDTDEIYFKSINFKSLALFGDTEFFEKLIYKYVTFEGHNHFKSAKLHKGLDLEYTNIQKEINFYGMEILDKTTTSQETYRIIKNQFEKLNNKIEANKYHALEMEQHRNNIWKNMFNCNSFFKLLPDGIVLLVHKLSSNHSSNWFLALFWIFVVSLITSWSLDSITVDNIFKYINILSKIEDFNCSYMAMTLNKVSLGYLYYQFLTAVRKDTRK